MASGQLSERQFRMLRAIANRGAFGVLASEEGTAEEKTMIALAKRGLIEQVVGQDLGMRKAPAVVTVRCTHKGHLTLMKF